jgi:hypothetical protein
MLQFVWDAIKQQRWLAAALALLFVGLHVHFTLKVLRSENSRSAFLRWQSQLAELDDGVNVWDKYAYPNPPIMAIILKPFHLLPPALGASLWFACKSLFALASILGVLALLDDREKPLPLWGKAIAVALAMRPIAGDLMHGNVNLLILGLIVLALIACAHRRDGWAGFLLGLGVACKITPALFLLYFLWKRAWLALAGMTAGVIVSGLLIPAAAFGWSENIEYLQSWHRQMVAPYAAGIVSSEHKNQSLPGLLNRMLCDQPSFSGYEGDEKIVLEQHNVVAWDPWIVQGIVIACMIAFAVLAVGHVSNVPNPARDGAFQSCPTERLRLIAEFGVVVLGMLLFCERTWKHHCVTLLIPFAALSYACASSSFTHGQRWFFGIALALSGILMVSTSTGVFDSHVEASERVGKLAQVYGAYVWAFLILLAASFLLLRWRR